MRFTLVVPAVSRRLTETVLVAGCLAGWPTTVAAQRTATLPAADGNLPEPVSSIAGLRELGDGRVLTTDPREKLIRVVDFSRGQARTVSRAGGGPIEFRNPGPLFSWAGDSAVMYDAPLSRLLIFDRSGNPSRSVELRQHLPRANSIPTGGELRFIDRSGNVYAQGQAIPVVGQGEPVQDSSPLVRLQSPGNRVDTLAMVKLSGLTQARTSTGTSMNIGAIANPFREQDTWLGFPDGRIGIVRSNPFRVDLVDAAMNRRIGSTIAVTRISVTNADRMRIMREGISLGAGRTVPIPEQALNDLPRIKPVFDYRTAIADPQGAIWVQRFRAALDTVPVYDVIDLNGALLRRVQLPIGSRIVGFGRAHVYVARRDDDDLQWLTRHPRP